MGRPLARSGPRARTVPKHRKVRLFARRAQWCCLDQSFCRRRWLVYLLVASRCKTIAPAMSELGHSRHSRDPGASGSPKSGR